MLKEIAEIVGLFSIGIAIMLAVVVGGWYLCYHLWLKDIDFLQKQYRKRILREKFEEHKYSEQYLFFESQRKTDLANSSSSTKSS
jgi:hypothetical protein